MSDYLRSIDLSMNVFVDGCSASGWVLEPVPLRGRHSTWWEVVEVVPSWTCLPRLKGQKYSGHAIGPAPCEPFMSAHLYADVICLVRRPNPELLGHSQPTCQLIRFTRHRASRTCDRNERCQPLKCSPKRAHFILAPQCDELTERATKRRP